MLYNIEKMKNQTMVDCQVCKFFNKKKKKCTGIGKTCFEYDEKTMTCIDPITKLPLRKLK